jgi:hypothetical protein
MKNTKVGGNVKFNFMNIKKKKNNLVVTIPIYQPTYDAIGEKIGYISNIVGIIEGDKVGFAKVIELGYKGSFDYGDFIVIVDMNKDDFRVMCSKLGLDCYEYERCVKCNKLIYGSHGWVNGPVCSDCDKK